MDILKLCLLTAALCTAAGADGLGEVEEVMEDFPLDDPGGEGDTSSEDGGGQTMDASSTSDDDNGLEDINLSELEQTEGNRQELLRRVMAAAMSKPGARQRLAQVMPILRTMSATQRLALAGLVTSQLMAAPGAPPPQINATKTNLTDDLMIPISMDIAAMFRGLGRDAAAARSNLFRGDLYKRHPPYRRKSPHTPNRRKTEVPHGDMRPPPPPRGQVHKLRPGVGQRHVNRFPPVARPEGGDCEYFTNSVCLQVTDYPMEAILKSIQSTPNKDAFEALRTDANTDFGEFNSTVEQQMERRVGDASREDQENNGHMCSSKVEIARPKRARATSGQWKYVVNTGDYTQTLRLEMCLKPQQPCSYLADNFKSECTQVYNYHRLLTWDQKSGLSMDIFKVPTCCSCHVHSTPYPFLPTQTMSESVRMPSQPVEPVRHATPPPRLNYVESPENNFVAADESPVIHRLPPPKQVLHRRPLGGLHNIPKRESLSPPRGVLGNSEEHVRYSYPPYENLLRRTLSRNVSEVNDIRPKYHPVQPTLNQRHPELPIDSLLADNTFSFVTSMPDYRPTRPPYQDSRFRSTTLPTTPRRVVTYPPSTTKRIVPSSQPTPTTHRAVTHTAPTQQTSSKRVNYSYHPIIDFFKTSVSAVDLGEDKLNNAEWTPITDGPKLMPK
ncbi:neurotrophin 1 [Homalodisca vitripennis]|uniref:neurotrophin 1 n=1 Tax=Homalodisca vitripennis TaxID=197043 RepID=UPI001EEC7229|nr:neurotrophin 1 [Homalodisca vitripennis]